VTALSEQALPRDVVDVQVKAVGASNVYVAVILEVRNKTSHPLRRIQFSCTVFDADRNPIGVDDGSMSNLAAGENLPPYKLGSVSGGPR